MFSLNIYYEIVRVLNHGVHKRVQDILNLYKRGTFLYIVAIDSYKGIIICKVFIICDEFSIAPEQIHFSLQKEKIVLQKDILNFRFIRAVKNVENVPTEKALHANIYLTKNTAY